jgi:hypothetical protein
MIFPQNISMRTMAIAVMKGEFVESKFTRGQYSSVGMQQARVQLDADWNEKLDVRIHDDIVYLNVWEREARAIKDESLEIVAALGPDTSSREANQEGSEEWCLRLTREVAKTGGALSKVQFALGRVDPGSNKPLILPESEVSVDGVPWKRVGSFSGAGPTDKVYVVGQDPDGSGSSRVEFGDGKNGARPATGARVIAGYRSGGGGEGNL